MDLWSIILIYEGQRKRYAYVSVILKVQFLNIKIIKFHEKSNMQNNELGSEKYVGKKTVDDLNFFKHININFHYCL